MAWRILPVEHESELVQGFVQDIAAKIGDVLRPYSKGSRAGLDTRDRLQRVLKQTQPIATVDLRPLSTQEGPTENGNSPSEPPVREDPMRLMLSPSWEVITLHAVNTSYLIRFARAIVTAACFTKPHCWDPFHSSTCMPHGQLVHMLWRSHSTAHPKYCTTSLSKHTWCAGT